MSRQRQKLFIIIGGGLAVTLLLLAILGHAAIARQMHAWKLLPEPERLTELYFTDHTHLLTTYLPGQTKTVAFTIHNLEYRTTTYTYVITSSSENATAAQALTGKTSLTLRQNQTSHISIPVILPDCGKRCKVSVTLDSGESINYLMTSLAQGEGL